MNRPSPGEKIVSEQIPFGTSDFAENPEPRCPCVLLLDVSGSMQGQPIRELNDGLAVYKDELSADSLAAKRVEVALVTFGGQVNVASEFSTVEQLTVPTLAASGDTPMGAAISQGLDMLRARKEQYRSNGIAFYRPWVFLITDGGPTDEWKAAAAQVKEGEARKSFAFFSVGVQGARMDILNQISSREPLKLQGLRFRDLFQWLSNSQQAVSKSTLGDEVPLQNPAAPGGWATV
jgi:uncharacterized protein YegL